MRIKKLALRPRLMAVPRREARHIDLGRAGLRLLGTSFAPKAFVSTQGGRNASEPIQPRRLHTSIGSGDQNRI